MAESFLCNVCVGVFGQRYDQTLSAFIENNMKIIYSSKGFYELYDLSTDMNERSNLASSYPEKTFELATKLQNFLTSFEHADSRGSHIEMDEATRKQLRALGYLQ